MNRKIILLPLVLTSMLVLAGCNNSSASSSSAPASTSSSKAPVAPTATTVSDLLDWVSQQDSTQIVTDSDTLYSVSGILECWAGPDGNDTYGDCYLTDGDKTILVYGSTTTTTCIAGDPGSYAFTNPKDAKTTLKDYVNGEKVTMTTMRVAYKGTAELEGFFTAHVADTTTYAASIDGTPDNGTAVLSKTSGITYGETLTVTCTPSTGYDIDKVIVTNRQDISTAAVVDADDATKYTFKAQSLNTVKVTFKVHEDVRNAYTLDTTGTTVPTAYAPGKTDTTAPEAVIIDSLSVVCFNVANYGNGLQFAGDASKYTAGLGRMYNTVATIRAIAKIDITFKASKYAKNAPASMTVSSGTAAMADALTTDDFTPVAGTAAGEYSYSYVPTNKTDTFFSVTKTATNTYAQYVESIVITLVAA